MNKAKILWESEGKSPMNGEPWITVKQARGYYEYAQRAGTDSIAFILIDSEQEKFGLIYESKPPLDEAYNEKKMLTTAFGGSCDMDVPLNEICQTEVSEESGYDVDLEQVVFMGNTLVSSQMNQICHLFLVDITGLTPTSTEADVYNAEQEAKDSDEFKHNKVIWMSADELMLNGDWKSIYIYAQLMLNDPQKW